MGNAKSIQSWWSNVQSALGKFLERELCGTIVNHETDNGNADQGPEVTSVNSSL